MTTDRATAIAQLDVTLTNIGSDSIQGPLWAVIDSVTDQVTVENADGTTDQGKPYYLYDELGDGHLDVQETTSAKTWYFHNPNNLRFSYTVIILAGPADDQPPVLNITNPLNGAVISNSTPWLTTRYYDAGSGIDSTTFSASIDGSDITSAFSVTESEAECQLSVPLAIGEHTLTVSISDNDGNTATADAVFQVTTSTAALRYLFSVSNNDWIFASAGDGSYIEYIKGRDLGLNTFADVVGLSKDLVNGPYYFTHGDSPGVLQSSADGVQTEYMANADMGLSADDRILALHKGLDNLNYFALQSEPDIRQSDGSGVYSFFLQNEQLGLTESDTLNCLHIGYDNTIYFCATQGQEILSSTGDNTHAVFLTAAQLGVSGGQIDAFATIPETIPPELTISNPADGAMVETMTPEVAIQFADSDAGIDPTSFGVTLDGADITNTFSVTESGATTQIEPPLTPGNHTLTATISDRVGNSSSATSTFTVDVMTVSINLAPASGPIPLTVAFSAAVTGGTPPYAYAWDTNGDQVTDDVRPSFSRIYSVAGSYPISLTVTDSNSNTATSTATVVARIGPTVQATAAPVLGQAPLTVDFSASANDQDGTVVLYEWDFEGDGTFDYSNATSPNTSYTFTVAGFYNAAIRVTDNDGLTAQDTISIQVGNAPTATAGASPLNGAVPLTVTFTGSGADADGTIALYEWDFDGDGSYDFASTENGNTTHSYTNAGLYNAVFRVTDNDGLIGVSSVRISVSGPPISLPRGFPTSGEAPLTVTFFANGIDLDGSPEYYDWDYDGNGTRDARLIASMNSTYTYSQPGTYNATLTVIDNEGLSSTATVQIQVTGTSTQGLPVAEAEAVPTNGGAPLEVQLVGYGTDPGGSITKYEWDFDGDGTFDFEEAESTVQLLGSRIGVQSQGKPFFIDIDADGDLDAYIGESLGRIQYFENIGTSTLPNWRDGGFVNDSSSNLIDVGSYSTPNLIDIDADGDLDAYIGESAGRILFLENTGDNQNPQWLQQGWVTDNSNAVIDVGSFATPRLVDIDADGDLDAYIGESGGRILFYENTGSSTAPVWENRSYVLNDETAGNLDVGSYAVPAFFDLDADGDLDMFIGNSSGLVLHWENVGTANSPAWRFIANLTDDQGTNIDAGSYAAPFLADLDGDNLLDLYIGNSNGDTNYYMNSGTSGAPIWTAMNVNYNIVSVRNYADPALVDIDADSDLDLLVGNYDGNIHLFENIGDATTAVYMSRGALADATGTVIDRGSTASPRVGDIDADGDMDLYYGAYDGRIYFYENTGTAAQYEWTYSGDYLRYGNGNIIDVGYYCRPALVDIDADGDLDIMAGESGGRIYFIRNDGTPGSASFTAAGYVNTYFGSQIDVGSYAAPAFFDLDLDGDLDMLIGDYNGLISFYRNIGSPAAPSWMLVTNNFQGISMPYMLCPTMADLDGDLDGDLIFGNSVGLTYLKYVAGNTQHTYTTPGQYTAVLRVTDNSDNTATDSVNISVLSAGSPSVSANVDPESGDVPLAVNLSGVAYDPNGTITLYEWDFDGDGTFDWSSNTTASTSHTYTQAGTFHPVLRVTDSEGLQAAVSVSIRANLNLTTGRTTIFDPVNGQTGTITTTLSGDSSMSLTIIDINGALVRNLLPSTFRTAGTYEDIWDGRDDQGNLVRDGVYYYIINYVNGDEETVLDLRENATYTETTPSRSWPSTFDPFTERFVNTSYNVAKPSEVSLYFWTRDYSRPGSSIAPVRTLILREPQEAGTHTATWDGVDDMGVTVPTSRQYRITLWVYDLADNAIIITGNRPEISGLDAEPNYFSPVFNPYAENANEYTLVNFNLSKAANLQVTVRNSDGIVVDSFVINDMPAGDNNIIWDGKDFNDDLVKDGAYTIQLTAIDIIGNRSLPRYASVYVFY